MSIRMTAAALAATAAAATLTGCGTPSLYGPSAPATVDAGAPTEAVGPGGGDTASDFPQALVGDWSGDDGRGVGHWDLRFDARGDYTMRNDRTGVTINGVATVSGAQITFQPVDAQPYTVNAQLSAGRLTLGGSVYLRTDAAAGGAAIVGRWMGLDNYNQTLTLTDDGQFQLVDDGKGQVTGTYTVSGSTLVLDTQRNGVVRVPWSVTDATLTVTWPNGARAQYIRG
jgi:hypothetical protein